MFFDRQWFSCVGLDLLLNNRNLALKSNNLTFKNASVMLNLSSFFRILPIFLFL